RIIAETAGRLGPVDILVANAGTGTRADLDDVDVAAWDHVMAVNLRAPFLLAQAAVPGMRERRFGRIVFLSSVAAYLGGILSPQYTASKAGLIGLAHSLAATLAPPGITVNAIAPGLVTPSTRPPPAGPCPTCWPAPRGWKRSSAASRSAAWASPPRLRTSL